MNSIQEMAVGDLCEFKYGKSLPEPLRRNGGVPVFGSNGVVGEHDQGITNGPASRHRKERIDR